MQQRIRSSMRELSADEVSIVAGGDGEPGDIVVMGRRENTFNLDAYLSLSFFSSGGNGGGGFGGFGGGGGGGGGPAPHLADPVLPQDDTILDNSEVVVTANSMPAGFSWATGDMGNYYLVNPAGHLVPNWSYALQMCQDYTDLNSGINTTYNGARLESLAGGPIGAIVGGIADLSLYAQQQLEGPQHPWCVANGDSVYDPRVAY